MAESVYFDTSVISYLTARPTRNPVVAARQIETIQWWTMQSAYFRLFSSDVAIEEASRGHPEAAQRRIEILQGMTILRMTSEAVSLGVAMLDGGAFPKGAEVDANHIAVAAVNGIDYILTWNFSHMANTATVPIIARVCDDQGYRSPVITTPNQLWGGD